MATLSDVAVCLPESFIEDRTGVLCAKIEKVKRELRHGSDYASRAITDLRLSRAAVAEGKHARRVRAAKAMAKKAETPSRIVSVRVQAEREMQAEVVRKARQRDTYIPEDFARGAKALCRDFAGTATRKHKTPHARISSGSVVMGVYAGNYTVVMCKHKM